MISNIYTQYFVQFILGLFVITLVLSIVNIVKLSQLNKKYKIFMNALSGKDVEKLLLENIELMQKVLKENEVNKNEIEKIKENMKSCLQKYSIVRYTAFEDVGSDLSFAIALLDGKDDGLILNGIYSREGSSVYAKSVHNGESKYNLSEEEQKALERAKRKGK